MAMTVAQGVALMSRRLEALRGVHRAPIEAADSIIAAELPIYTGAYKAAVKVDFGASASEIYVSTGSLEATNAALAADLGGSERVYADLHGEGPAGPYPVRIEVHGGPATGDGAGAWSEAKKKARQVLREEIEAVRSSG